jgi:hypothetical protein
MDMDDSRKVVLETWEQKELEQRERNFDDGSGDFCGWTSTKITWAPMMED